MKALGAGDQLADEAEHDERPELEWDDARGEALYRDRFEAFYRERFGPMVKLAVLLTGSQEVGRDVVQDAFVRVHRRFEHLENSPAYLRTTVVNGCRSWQRRRGVERRFAIRQPPPPPSTLGASEMDDALRRLPFRQRAALVLRFYGGFTEAEIADSLGCRPGTVGPLIHRGLAALKEVIEP